jgi:putative polyhydroxyalkanoate system protein
MSTIDITRAHALPKSDARTRAEEFAKSMQERFDLDWRWEGDAIRFDAPRGAAKGTKGEVTVTDKDVRVVIELPMLLRMLKGTIEAKVHEKLEKLL